MHTFKLSINNSIQMKNAIVDFLKHQASNYNRDATIANRKTVQKEARVKADCLYGIAKFLEEARIEND